jgi:hypothetical protein
MLFLLRRLWDIVVGSSMIVLSLFFQLLLLLIICTITIPMFFPSLSPIVSLPALLILFNGISCYEYFRRRRVVTLNNTIHKFKGLVRPDSRHAAMAIFLVPRGIDRILTGSEFTG